MTEHRIQACLDLRHSILEKFVEPIIFTHAIDDWDILSWSLNNWADALGKKLLPFRVGEKKGTKRPQWEHGCKNEYMTLEEFLRKLDVDEKSSEVSHKWWYFDYKYMHQWFLEFPEILKTVNWSKLGFPEREGKDSTLWLGSSGAHTPCHLDMYGCNLVAQVLGRKRWFLFPPTLVDEMEPTRFPYEESSIFSMHNFFYPSSKTMKVNFSGVRVVTLEPGQVLFVPRHWWHYVENLETAISINTWLPLAADDESRLEESLVRLLVAQACKILPHPECILNPNEGDLPECPVSDTLNLVQESLVRCLQNPAVVTCSKDDLSSTFKKSETDLPASAIVKYERPILYVPECPLPIFQQLLVQRNNEVELTDDGDDSQTETLLQDCINAFCHPSVVAVARSILLNRGSTSFYS